MITINDKVFQPEYFPDMTLRLRCYVKEDFINIHWNFESNEEMVTLYFLTNHLRRVCNVNVINLYMPYIPNARMDRVKQNDEVFTLKYFTEFINDLQFNSVHVRDAHSNVSLALLDRVVQDDIMPTIKALANELLVSENDLVFFPDEGSCKRYGGQLEKNYAFGIKQRDWRTGEILHFDVVGNDIKEGFNALIIDDISSYGTTFYYSALKLKELGANKIWLYITHCENNILDGKLTTCGLIENIYTTDSIFTKEHPLIQKIERR